MTNISITDPVSLYVFYTSSSLAKGRQKKTSSVIDSERNLTDSRLIVWYSPSRIETKPSRFGSKTYITICLCVPSKGVWNYTQCAKLLCKLQRKIVDKIIKPV